jgi:hypothetical protein
VEDFRVATIHRADNMSNFVANLVASRSCIILMHPTNGAISWVGAKKNEDQNTHLMNDLKIRNFWTGGDGQWKRSSQDRPASWRSFMVLVPQ